MFEFRKIGRSDPLLRDVYGPRYRVYCLEWGFERDEDCPQDEFGKLEKDGFDEHSVHFAAIRKNDGGVIGTIRVVLDSEKGFPIEEHCQIDMDMSRVDRRKLGEISRLAVSKQY